MREHIIGISVNAAVIDTTMITHIIQPNCLKSTPAIPVIMVSGKNTASMVRVDATTEIATSFVP